MHWIQFNEWCARRSTRGQIRTSDEIRATWSHTKLIINNLTVPTGPSRMLADLKARGQAAVADAAPHMLPWMFGVSRAMAPGQHRRSERCTRRYRVAYMMYMTVMECEGRLAQPLRPLPTDVDIRGSRRGRWDLMHLNLTAGLTVCPSQ